MCEYLRSGVKHKVAMSMRPGATSEFSLRSFLPQPDEDEKQRRTNLRRDAARKVSPVSYPPLPSGLARLSVENIQARAGSNSARSNVVRAPSASLKSSGIPAPVPSPHMEDASQIAVTAELRSKVAVLSDRLNQTNDKLKACEASLLRKTEEVKTHMSEKSKSQEEKKATQLMLDKEVEARQRESALFEQCAKELASVSGTACDEQERDTKNKFDHICDHIKNTIISKEDDVAALRQINADLKAQLEKIISTESKNEFDCSSRCEAAPVLLKSYAECCRRIDAARGKVTIAKLQKIEALPETDLGLETGATHSTQTLHPYVAAIMADVTDRIRKRSVDVPNSASKIPDDRCVDAYLRCL